ncbi:hypothetical protein P746_00440 [Enterococcus faecalis CBRD01]|nr:hypothetical protein P746_00440 [Enterococcus faecalis CBRD01]
MYKEVESPNKSNRYQKNEITGIRSGWNGFY